VATSLGQPINLAQTGLIQAANRRLSAPLGAEEEDPTAMGIEGTLTNPFAQSLDQMGMIPQAPTQMPQAQVRQFGFNPKFSQVDAGFQRQLGDLGLQRSNSIFQAEDRYKTQTDDANRLQQTAMQRLKDTLGIRGLGMSTVNVNEQGKLNENYVRMMDNLSRMRGNNLYGIEQGYAQGVEGINQGREGLWFQQVAEEEENARQRAREEAENQRIQQQIAAQQAWQQQQAAQQAQYQQQMLQQAAQQRQFQQPPSIGVGGGGGGAPTPYGDAAGNKYGEGAFVELIRRTNDKGFLLNLWNEHYELPSHIRQEVLNRIQHDVSGGPGAMPW